MRADHLIEDNLPDVKVEGLPVEKLTEIIKENHLKCPKCGKENFTDELFLDSNFFSLIVIGTLVNFKQTSFSNFSKASLLKALILLIFGIYNPLSKSTSILSNS